MSSSVQANRSHEKLVVAICTYRRPRALLTLLSQLSAIEGRDHAIVLVVDNDPDRSAEHVVHDFNETSSAGIVYTHAKPQGIATARNVALDFGGKRSLAVLFIDDDELPEATWLTSMLSKHASLPSAIIVGPVRPEFIGTLPNWAPDGFFWRRTEYADGESISVPVGSGNMLCPTKITIGGLRFDTDFDLAGGEDTHFTLRWLAANERIVWSAQSVANERVPQERLSLQYARERAYFTSMGYQHAIQKLTGHRRTLSALRVARRWGLAALLWVYGKVASSTPMVARAQIHAAVARGTWAGMQGQWVNRWAKYQVDV